MHLCSSIDMRNLLSDRNLACYPVLASDYSCAVKATIFRYSDEIALLTYLFVAGLKAGGDPCV